jgi:hypothetical protein
MNATAAVDTVPATELLVVFEATTGRRRRAASEELWIADDGKRLYLKSLDGRTKEITLAQSIRWYRKVQFTNQRFTGGTTDDGFPIWLAAVARALDGRTLAH